MLKTDGFAPHWASPPGDTIRQALSVRGLSVSDFSRALGIDDELADGLLTGQALITLGIARQLASRIGGTPSFWMTRDAQYRDDLAWQAAEDWSSRLPTSEMVRLGWIPPTSDWREEVEECLAFFEVEDIREWAEVHGERVGAAKFRRSQSVFGTSEAVAAWLHRGLQQVAGESTAPWDPVVFHETLPQIRKLTKLKDPRSFVPRLKALAGEAGVRVALLEAPTGCPVSGVAYSPHPGAPVIVLSARFRSDDHLWFTFFHEAGHLILHDSSRAYVDDLSNDVRASSGDEAEADVFAQEALIPTTVIEDARARARLDARTVVRLAAHVGVAPGVLVGQLQHEGVLGFEQLNSLKRRYRWRDSSLEIA